jgi:hypothetical protein
VANDERAVVGPGGPAVPVLGDLAKHVLVDDVVLATVDQLVFIEDGHGGDGDELTRVVKYGRVRVHDGLRRDVVPLIGD